MNEETSRLILRRTDSSPGHRICVRLSEEVPRDADLYPLFRSGFQVEVIEVGKTNGGSLSVTLGLLADPAFQIDRGEKVCLPRTDDERGAAPIIRYPRIPSTQMEDWDVPAFDDYLLTLRQALNALQSQLKLLRLDKSKAAERGWRLRSNDNYDRWLMINEEIDHLAEQIGDLEVRLGHVKARRKTKVRDVSELRANDFNASFVETARELLSEEEFQKLSGSASAASTKNAA